MQRAHHWRMTTAADSRITRLYRRIGPRSEAGRGRRRPKAPARNSTRKTRCRRADDTPRDRRMSALEHLTRSMFGDHLHRIVHPVGLPLAHARIWSDEDRAGMERGTPHGRWTTSGTSPPTSSSCAGIAVGRVSGCSKRDVRRRRRRPENRRRGGRERSGAVSEHRSRPRRADARVGAQRHRAGRTGPRTAHPAGGVGPAEGPAPRCPPRPSGTACRGCAPRTTPLSPHHPFPPHARAAADDAPDTGGSTGRGKARSLILVGPGDGRSWPTCGSFRSAGPGFPTRVRGAPEAAGRSWTGAPLIPTRPIARQIRASRNRPRPRGGRG